MGVYQTEKYLARGFRTTMALVDCSGCNWNSSDSEIPMRSAPSIFRIGKMNCAAMVGTYRREGAEFREKCAREF